MDSSTATELRVAEEGKGNGASSWSLFLRMLPPGARVVAWLLYPVRAGFFSEDLQVFRRLAEGPDAAQVAWVRGYLCHPRYRRASWLRRLGMRGRVSLLDQWARRNGHGMAWEGDQEET